MKKIVEIVEFTVREDIQKRLDVLLSNSYPDISRTYAKKLIEEGYVLVNGKCRKPSFKPKKGDIITLFLPEPEQLEVKPQNIPITVIYEDKDIAVITKPCGLVVHPSPGYTSGTLVNALLFHLKDLSSIGGKERPGIVHRLDRQTAGLMVVAKNDKAHLNLVNQFTDGNVKKLYKVLVKGIVPQDYGTVDFPIGRNPVHRKKFSVFSPVSKPALSEFWVLERFNLLGITLLKVKIHTGRTHQIRVHMSSLGFPVLGDTTYGFKRKSVPQELNLLMGDCNMLVAYKLGFRHPSTGNWLEFEIEDPSPFREVLGWIRRFQRAASF